MTNPTNPKERRKHLRYKIIPGSVPVFALLDDSPNKLHNASLIELGEGGFVLNLLEPLPTNQPLTFMFNLGIITEGEINYTLILDGKIVRQKWNDRPVSTAVKLLPMSPHKLLIWKELIQYLRNKTIQIICERFIKDFLGGSNNAW
jgi:hypothetical protein